jgi:hypothetical protein
MATSVITGGNLVIDPVTSGQGWGEGILTLPAPASGVNRMRFAYQLDIGGTDLTSSFEVNGASWRRSMWFGLNFLNSHLTATEMVDITDSDADSFFGFYSTPSNVDPNKYSVRRSGLGSPIEDYWRLDWFGGGAVEGQDTYFSFGEAHTTSTRLNGSSMDALNVGALFLFPGETVNAARITFGWEIYKHETTKQMFFRGRIDGNSISESNIMDIFNTAFDVEIIIHGDITSNWVDAGGNVTFPRYFIVHIPYIGVTDIDPRTFIIRALGVDYLTDS